MQCIKAIKLLNGRLVPFVEFNGKLVQVAWAPLPGSQEAFLKANEIELLLHGPRGTGKSEAQLAKNYFIWVGKGYGTAARSVLLRRTMPQVAEIVKLSRDLFPRISPDAKFNEMKSTWTFPGGETLWITHFDSMQESANFLGHSYVNIMFEELTQWPDPKPYLFMLSTLRSPVPGIPRLMSATTNPMGVGKNWIQQRFRLIPGDLTMIGDAITDSRGDDGSIEPPRRAIRSFMEENLFYQITQPDYRDRVAASTQGSEAAYKAHVLGDWGFSGGGMFDDIWAEVRRDVVVPRFDVPEEWRIYRALDFGTSKPGAVLWFTISNGDSIIMPDESRMDTLKGDIFILDELYFWNGRANEGLRLIPAEQARRIKDHEATRFPGWKIKRGPADSQIFSDDLGESIARTFERGGVHWDVAPKGPNSRAQGWVSLRGRMLGARRFAGDVRVDKGIFVCDCCTQWLRTVPVLQRDEKNLRFEDVDDSSEDHMGDCTRYMLAWEPMTIWSGRVTGI